MSKSNRYSPEVRERAARMVLEHEGGYPSRWQAICLIASKIGCSPDSLKAWLTRSEVDAGNLPGTTSEEAARIKGFEKEVRELAEKAQLVDKGSNVEGTQEKENERTLWANVVRVEPIASKRLRV